MEKSIKKLGNQKRLTQEEICGDFLARSTLARIESGQVVQVRYHDFFTSPDRYDTRRI